MKRVDNRKKNLLLSKLNVCKRFYKESSACSKKKMKSKKTSYDVYELFINSSYNIK